MSQVPEIRQQFTNCNGTDSKIFLWAWQVSEFIEKGEIETLLKDDQRIKTLKTYCLVTRINLKQKSWKKLYKIILTIFKNI